MQPLVPSKKAVSFPDIAEDHTVQSSNCTPPAAVEKHSSSEGATHAAPKEDPIELEFPLTHNDDDIFWDCGNSQPGSLRLFPSMASEAQEPEVNFNVPFPEEAIELENAFETLDNANFGIHTLQAKDQAGPPQTSTPRLNSNPRTTTK